MPRLWEESPIPSLPLAVPVHLKLLGESKLLHRMKASQNSFTCSFTQWIIVNTVIIEVFIEFLKTAGSWSLYILTSFFFFLNILSAKTEADTSRRYFLLQRGKMALQIEWALLPQTTILKLHPLLQTPKYYADCCSCVDLVLTKFWCRISWQLVLARYRILPQFVLNKLWCMSPALFSLNASATLQTLQSHHRWHKKFIFKIVTLCMN